MNPENNALSRTYFIAGPMRVGKTTLAYRLAEKIGGHVVSTDAIRNAAKKVCENKTGPLFRINTYNDLSEEEWLDRHFNHPEAVVQDLIGESEAIWRSVVSFCNVFCEDNARHIVEGIALLPHLVAGMDHRPEHIVYVGNTSSTHVDTMLDYGIENPEQCWMRAIGYSEERIRGMANLVFHLSLHLKAEAEKYGFRYIEISDEKFDQSVDQVISELTRV